jgi:small subunit ribosomal protein S8
MNDSLGDMLIRIQNALMAGHQSVTIPHSKMKEAVAQILVDNQYVGEMKVIEAVPQKGIELTLRYVGKLPAISGVKRVSKPGRRLYAGAKSAPATLGGYGLTILTTSKGVMTSKDARKQNVGGEIICQVW